MIPYGRQDINRADVESVIKVLESDFITQGPVVPKFENALKNHCSCNHAVAVNSATSALHVACMALGVGSGDIVWTSPITFVASANCAIYCGADVDFVDIDIQTFNICVDKLRRKLKNASVINKLPKVVIPVHLCGQSCDMAAIHALSKEYGFSIIEDASHALGGRYLGKPIGNCQYSDITVFSFHPVKMITSAEGGMAVTNDERLCRKMELYRTHGISRDTAEMTTPSEGPWFYQQLDIGYNYRMSDLHAALGLSQFERLDGFIEKRHEIATNYREMFLDMPIVTPFSSPHALSSYHLYVIRLNLESFAITHKEIFEKMRNAGIGVGLHYIPVYKHPYYANRGFQHNYCANAEIYYSTAISLPIHTQLTAVEQEYVVNVISRLVIK